MTLKAIKIDDYLDGDYNKAISLGIINTSYQKVLVANDKFYVEEYKINQDVFKSQVKVYDINGKYLGAFDDDLHMRISNQKISYYNDKFNMLLDLDNSYTYMFKQDLIYRTYLGIVFVLVGMIFSSPLNILKRGDE
ncbi:hypothetical protein CI105_08725 [Candidatus Izimaplasma bacterium ZiA1]|nr:hypothetical protein CI105_08725 [Candidatus Izimaplasma bacterium ZiA1]